MKEIYFFKVISKEFENKYITTIDISGGSVQIIQGIFKNGEYSLDNSLDLKTGCKNLSKISKENNLALDTELECLLNIFQTNIKDIFTTDIFVLGSNQMKDFILSVIPSENISEENLYTNHNLYINQTDLKNLANKVKNLNMNERFKIWDNVFMYDLNYVLANLITVAKVCVPKRIYPSNLSCIYFL